MNQKFKAPLLNVHFFKKYPYSGYLREKIIRVWIFILSTFISVNAFAQKIVQVEGKLTHQIYSDSPQEVIARRILSTDDSKNASPDIDVSFDGQSIVFVEETSGGLFIYDLPSKAITQIVPGLPSFWNFSPVWSPKRDSIAFISQDQLSGTYSIKIFILETRTTILVPKSDSEEWSKILQWSKDGHYLLCESPPKLKLVCIENGNKSIIVDNLSIHNGCLSPDNNLIVYMQNYGDNTQIFLQSLKEGKREQITMNNGGNINPVWAPDGHALAYQNHYGIWIEKIVNGEPTGDAKLAISASNINLIRWTNKGLCYIQYTDGGLKSIPLVARMNLDTNIPKFERLQVLDGFLPDSISAFAWSPDMNRIAFAHRQSPNIIITSKNPKSIITWNLGLNGHVRRFMWSQDGQKIFYEPDAQYWRPQGSTILELDPTNGIVEQLFPRIKRAARFSLSADKQTVSFYEYSEDIASSVPVWPSAGSQVKAIVVTNINQKNERTVATSNQNGEVPFSSVVRPVLTNSGDRILFVRQSAINDPQLNTLNAASLWIVDIDGLNLQLLAKAVYIESAIWDPTGRFIAYTAKLQSGEDNSVLKLIEVSSKIEIEIPLPSFVANKTSLYDFVRAVDWSSDGKLLGLIAGHDFNYGWECWILQGI